MSPFNAFLFLQGLESLHVRMERHCENTMAVATFLAEHPRVSWVNYPGLADNPYHALANRYMPRGASSVLCFGIEGGVGRGRALHRGRAVHESSRERRRREDPGHPPGLHHAPPAR